MHKFLALAVILSTSACLDTPDEDSPATGQTEQGVTVTFQSQRFTNANNDTEQTWTLTGATRQTSTCAILGVHGDMSIHSGQIQTSATTRAGVFLDGDQWKVDITDGLGAGLTVDAMCWNVPMSVLTALDAPSCDNWADNSCTHANSSIPWHTGRRCFVSQIYNNGQDGNAWVAHVPDGQGNYDNPSAYVDTVVSGQPIGIHVVQGPGSTGFTPGGAKFVCSDFPSTTAFDALEEHITHAGQTVNTQFETNTGGIACGATIISGALAQGNPISAGQDAERVGSNWWIKMTDHFHLGIQCFR